MKQINWNAEKNQQLMSERGVYFEDVLFALQSGGLLDDGPHPNRGKYPDQRLFVVRIDDYAWLVPYVENGTSAPGVGRGASLSISGIQCPA